MSHQFAVLQDFLQTAFKAQRATLTRNKLINTGVHPDTPATQPVRIGRQPTHIHQLAVAANVVDEINPGGFEALHIGESDQSVGAEEPCREPWEVVTFASAMPQSRESPLHAMHPPREWVSEHPTVQCW